MHQHKTDRYPGDCTSLDELLVPLGSNHLLCQVNLSKITFWNCRERHKNMTDHHSYAHNLSSCSLHQYRRGHRFKSRSGLNFFFSDLNFTTAYFISCAYITAIISSVFMHSLLLILLCVNFVNITWQPAFDPYNTNVKPFYKYMPSLADIKFLYTLRTVLPNTLWEPFLNYKWSCCHWQ